ncbi:MAG: hypothetical protein RLW61_15505 [Gammaproteobacteria bacterium]
MLLITTTGSHSSIITGGSSIPMDNILPITVIIRIMVAPRL